MFRPLMPFVLALLALGVSVTVAAKTSISNPQQTELPCPANRSDTIDIGAPNTSAPASPTVGDAATVKPNGKAARQRWKVLLPGSLKSTS